MPGDPRIAEFMRRNDQSVDPPRASTFVRVLPGGSELWEDEQDWLRVWPNGSMEERPKTSSELPPGRR